MRVSLLLKREPFKDILEKTLTKFLDDHFQKQHQVQWQKKFTQDCWIINPYLNAIFIPRADKKVFTPIKNEFSQAIKWWRQPFQKLFLIFSLNRLTAQFFSCGFLKITPQLEQAQEKLIIPGNHHIRLLDFEKQDCFVIQKTGFNQIFFQNEIKVRKKNPFLLTPKIKQATDYWYQEELITGIPANRLKNQEQKKQALEKVKQSLQELYQKTKQEQETKTYVRQLSQEILELAKEKQDIKKLLLKILEKIKTAHLKPTITLAQTHGDFQEANILIKMEQVWLIDWEYTDIRQLDYDLLVFKLKTRSLNSLSQRFHAFHHESALKYIFLLEELKLRLQENNNPLFSRPEPGLIIFCQELEKLLK